MTPWTQCAWIAASTSLLMLVLWAISARTRNASHVDAGWSAALGLAAVFCAATGDGEASRRLLVGLLGGAWGLRLTWHLITDRLRGKPEDGRYQDLRRRWGDRANLWFFVFFQVQALFVVLLCWPFVLGAAAASPLCTTDLVATGLWLGAMLGESLADRQLKRFKGLATSAGRTCRIGLWRYSRHPNYFFEWLLWIAHALLAVSGPHGWVAFSAPALLLFLVLKVTGIPPTEARALASRGEDYRLYQRTTSAFIPWFPRPDPIRGIP